MTFAKGDLVFCKLAPGFLYEVEWAADGFMGLKGVNGNVDYTTGHYCLAPTYIAEYI